MNHKYGRDQGFTRFRAVITQTVLVGQAIAYTNANFLYSVLCIHKI